MFWKWIKVPKAVALLAFLLPWMTVSCQGQPLAKATGLGLTFGSIETFGQASQAGGGDFNIWLLLAILAIAGGLAITFLRGKTAAILVGATSLAALVLVWLGTRKFSLDALVDEVGKSEMGKGQDATAMLAMMNIEWHFGYYLTVLALLVSLGMAVVVHLGKEAEVSKTLGDFADTARKQVAAASAAATAAATGEGVTCPKCGTKLAAGTRFCPEDGTAIPESGGDSSGG